MYFMARVFISFFWRFVSVAACPFKVAHATNTFEFFISPGFHRPYSH